MLCSLKVKLLLDKELRIEEADKIANKDKDMTLCKLCFCSVPICLPSSFKPSDPICLLEYIYLIYILHFGENMVTHMVNNLHVTLDKPPHHDQDPDMFLITCIVFTFFPCFFFFKIHY